MRSAADSPSPKRYIEAIQHGSSEAASGETLTLPIAAATPSAGAADQPAFVEDPSDRPTRRRASPPALSPRVHESKPAVRQGFMKYCNILIHSHRLKDLVLRIKTRDFRSSLSDE